MKTKKNNINDYIGKYKTFKEARKNAREVAKITGYYAYIKIQKEEIPYYIVKAYNDSNLFDYYVCKDGRVCPKSVISKENRKWARHPEKKEYSRPFNKVRNRKKTENKDSYRKEMNLVNPCKF